MERRTWSGGGGWGGDVSGAGGEMQQRTLCIIFPFLKNGHEPVSD